eukprot:NODE_89_length_3353_cov_27.255751_g80_i0.p1 GENE.NODE_89_length_3353_cov_27.255751_g80_i0~~NODE_89_length_3353_cov_27.255751_g80_i0.p1  ORF type:complete len:1033 (-),score=185.10 NODE_89_length_3353_cov_27.255751_g80_i0:138-3236(-)
MKLNDVDSRQLFPPPSSLPTLKTRSKAAGRNQRVLSSVAQRLDEPCLSDFTLPSKPLTPFVGSPSSTHLRGQRARNLGNNAEAEDRLEEGLRNCLHELMGAPTVPRVMHSLGRFAAVADPRQKEALAQADALKQIMATCRSSTLCTVHEAAFAAIQNLTTEASVCRILLNAQIVPVIIRHMKRQTNTPAVHVRLIQCIGRLGLHEDCQQAILQEGGIYLLTKNVRKHSGLLEVQATGCSALRNLTTRGTGMLEAVVAEDGIPTLLEALSTHSASTKVVEPATKTLLQLCRLQHLIIQIGDIEGGIGVVTKALHILSRTNNIPPALWDLLRVLADPAQNRPHLLTHNVQPYVLQHICRQPHPDLLAGQLHILSRTLHLNAEEDLRDLEPELGVDQLVDLNFAVEQCSARQDVMREGCSFVGDYGTFGPAAVGALVDADIAAVPILALEKHMASADVVGPAAAALAVLSRHPKGKSSVVARGGITVLLRAVKEFSSKAEVVVSVCQALEELCARVEYRHMAREEGALKSARALLEIYRGSVLVLPHVIRWLKHFAREGSQRAGLRAQGFESLLLEIMKRHRARPQVQSEAADFIRLLGIDSTDQGPMVSSGAITVVSMARLCSTTRDHTRACDETLRFLCGGRRSARPQLFPLPPTTFARLSQQIQGCALRTFKATVRHMRTSSVLADIDLTEYVDLAMQAAGSKVESIQEHLQSWDHKKSVTVDEIASLHLLVQDWIISDDASRIHQSLGCCRPECPHSVPVLGQPPHAAPVVCKLCRTFYCSRDCQLYHWPTHSRICSVSPLDVINAHLALIAEGEDFGPFKEFLSYVRLVFSALRALPPYIATVYCIIDLELATWPLYQQLCCGSVFQWAQFVIGSCDRDAVAREARQRKGCRIMASVQCLGAIELEPVLQNGCGRMLIPPGTVFLVRSRQEIDEFCDKADGCWHQEGEQLAQSPLKGNAPDEQKDAKVERFESSSSPSAIPKKGQFALAGPFNLSPSKRQPSRLMELTIVQQSNALDAGVDSGEVDEWVI